MNRIKLIVIFFLFSTLFYGDKKRIPEIDYDFLSNRYPIMWGEKIKEDTITVKNIKKGIEYFNIWIKNNRQLVNREKGLEFMRLNNLILNRINFEGLKIDYTFFNGTSLRSANFNNTEISSPSFKYADLRGANFNNAEIIYTNFSYANLSNIVFRAKYIVNTMFFKTNFENADFSKTKLYTGRVDGTNGPVFLGANLKNANLSNQNGYPNFFGFVRCNLTNTNFRNSDLSEKSFVSAYLMGADFTGSDLAFTKIEKRWKPYLEKFKPTIKHWHLIKWVDDYGPFNPNLNPDLINAIKNNDFDKTKELLEKGADPDAIEDGSPALNLAVFKNNFDIVKLLLSRQAYINIIDKNGNTPLMTAVVENNIDMVKFLLNQKKVNPKIINFSNQTAFSLSVEKGHSDIENFFKSKDYIGDIGVIIGNVVNVREKPDMSSKLIAQLKEGEKVFILELTNFHNNIGRYKDFWYKIKTFNGKIGFIYGAFIYSLERLFKHEHNIGKDNENTLKFSFNRNGKFKIESLYSTKGIKVTGNFEINGREIILTTKNSNHSDFKVNSKIKLFLYRSFGENYFSDYVLTYKKFDAGHDISREKVIKLKYSSSNFDYEFRE